jgi:hypothetical protein
MAGIARMVGTCPGGGQVRDWMHDDVQCCLRQGRTHDGAPPVRPRHKLTAWLPPQTLYRLASHTLITLTAVTAATSFTPATLNKVLLQWLDRPAALLDCCCCCYSWGRLCHSCYSHISTWRMRSLADVDATYGPANKVATLLLLVLLPMPVPP